jgi:hypothetical protein
MKRNAWIQRSVFIALTLAPMASFAGVDHAYSSPTPGKISRPKGIWDIQKYVDTLSAFFRWPVESVRRDYFQSLPIALENVVKRKDETKVAEALSQLFATVNPDQIKLIEDFASAKLAAKLEEEKTDSEAIALLERIEWAAKGLLGHPPEKDGKNSAFMDAFFGKKGAYSKTLAEKQIIRDNIKVANDPNTSDATRKSAKKWLRTNLSREAIMAFVEGQWATGRKDLAMNLVDAVAWIDPNSKTQRFLEFFTGAGAERLYLGPDRETMEAALSAYAKSKGGLHTATLAEKEHETVIPKEYVSQNGSLALGRPVGVAAPKAFPVKTLVSALTPKLSPTLAAGAIGLSSVLQGAALSARRKTHSKPASTSDKDAALFAVTCTAQCHSSWPKEKGEMKTSILSRSMPKNRTLSQGEINSLIAHLSK